MTRGCTNGFCLSEMQDSGFKMQDADGFTGRCGYAIRDPLMNKIAPL